jgi:hypothetical protein
METKQLVREIAMLIVSAETAELAIRLGGSDRSEALDMRIIRLIGLGADADDLAGIVDAGRRAGALLAAVDEDLPSKDPAAELCRIGERHVAKANMAKRVDDILSGLEVKS